MTNTNGVIAEVTMVYHKKTKRTYVYKEVDGSGNIVDQVDAHLGSTYIKQRDLPNPPERITVTVKAAQ